MKHFKLLLLLITTIIFQSCINDDIIDDRIDEKLSINNLIQKLTINSTYQYTTKYTNNIGEVKNPTIRWSSSQPTIISVNSTGLITALKEGQSTITAAVTSSEGKTITVQNNVTATKDVVNNNGPKEKSGTIRTTSSYRLTGNFKLKEIPNTKNLELIIDTNYKASSNLPGLYLYLTNNPNTVNGAKEVSKVSVFNGAHKYLITNTSINDFNHLLYWCKPFSVKVGDGEIK